MNPVIAPSSILDKRAHADLQEEAQSKQEVTTNKIPKPKRTAIEGKHIAKRPVGKWPDYGDPNIWDEQFEYTVEQIVDDLKNNKIDGNGIVNLCERSRNRIATLRNNPKSEMFGVRRDGKLYTPLLKNNFAYGYALERAVNLKYNHECYVEKQSKIGEEWVQEYFARFCKAPRYGLVQGRIGDETIPLTQFIFCHHIPVAYSELLFGHERDYIVGIKGYPESAIWLHSDSSLISKVMPHIHQMIDKAINGDLTQIPRIHWWYVQLAPTWRGPGGIAEMITNSICRYHDIDLPGWGEGIASSVEILLEPDEENFCKKYHTLFEVDQDKLREIFQGGTLDA